jgi:phosphatidylglycerol:prolipoprotein diacylglycerol transferase
MYPVLFRIGTFEVTSFGALVATAALVALWVFGRELRRSGLPEAASDAAIVGVIGGFVGAKVLWTIEFSGDGAVMALLFSRGGFSWFGGLIGGVGSGLWMLHRKRVPLVPALSAAAPALAVGHAIGRIGCFLVGDDYGRPSSLPWAVAFPQGLPPTTERVHPTQLYETLALACLAWLLIAWRRRDMPDLEVIGRYLVFAATIRFAIEFVRVNRAIAGPLTLAQLISLTLICFGTLLLRRSKNLAVRT